MRTSAAEYLIRQRVLALGRALPAARAGDPVSLHHARVATRRLRAALPLMSRGEKTDKLARSVRRLTRALGPIRELDVALLVLEELEKGGDVPRAAIERLRRSVSEERDHLQTDVREELEGFDIEKVRERAVEIARKSDKGRRARERKRGPELRERAARRAQRLNMAIENAAGLYLPDRLHAVRIAVKKLRYTLELAQRPGASRGAGRIRTLVNAQDLLGRMHDLEVLIARTRGIQSSPGASTLKESSDLDRLVRRLENECRQLHSQYMAARPTLLSLCRRLTADGKARAHARSSAA